MGQARAQSAPPSSTSEVKVSPAGLSKTAESSAFEAVVSSHPEPPPVAPELLPPPPPKHPTVSLHPDVVLRDGAGQPVVKSGKPVSTLSTCGACHDAAWIASHDRHADFGFGALTDGPAPSGRSWDFGTGPWGRFDPLTYDLPVAPGAPASTGLERLRWAEAHPERLLGGGPIGDRAELNCLACHLRGADQKAARAEFAAGRFEWASTAALVGTGLVTQTQGGWTYAMERFNGEGAVSVEVLPLGRPSSESCGQCHGLVTGAREVLTPASFEPTQRMTELTGTVFSPARLRDSALDLAGKDGLHRPWDVHAQRLVGCADCHFSPNDPRYTFPRGGPAHLSFDPRRLSEGEFLWRPSHQFAAGTDAQDTGPGERGAMRRCEDCHDASRAHGWLPRRERHFAVLACESCHIDRAWAPARQETDYTLPAAPDGVSVTYRGYAEEPGAGKGRLVGYAPALLPRRELDGKTRWYPYNLMTTWLWVGGVDGREVPVPRALLERALFDNGHLRPEVLAALDHDHDGRLSDEERRLVSATDQAVVAGRLQAVGVAAPRIVGEISAHGLHHGVAQADLATRDCSTCHSDGSRFAQVVLLSRRAPEGVLPHFLADGPGAAEGQVERRDDGALVYRPQTAKMGLYLFGHSRWPWLDLLGAAAFLGSLLGVSVHGGLRFLAARRRRPTEARS